MNTTIRRMIVGTAATIVASLPSQADTPRLGEAFGKVASAPQAVVVTKARNDFNGDGRSDLLWRNANSGMVWETPMNGATTLPGGLVWTEADAHWKITASADLDGDGKSDLVWTNDQTGMVYGMLMNGLTVKGGAVLHTEPDLNWQVIAVDDFSGTGKAGLLWRHAPSGMLYMLPMDGLTEQPGAVIWTEPDATWEIVGTGDFNGDGKADILWRNKNTGMLYVLFLNGASVTGGQVLYTEPDTNWKIVAIADYNGDGTADLLWRNVTNGMVYVMPIVGAAVQPGAVVWTETDLKWQIEGVGDYDGDGKADILYRNQDSGMLFQLLMNGTAVKSQGLIYQEPDTTWGLQVRGTQLVTNPSPSLSIVGQPQSTSVHVGEKATFSVTASGGTGALHYAWTQNGTAVGTDAATYTTATTTLADSGAQIVVKVTDGASHTVTSNPAILTVLPAAPTSVKYASATVTYYVGVAIKPNYPVVQGGTPTSYTVSPALPAGLSMDPVTGFITGTPTATATANAYTVTAGNTGGSVTSTVNITVAPKPTVTFSGSPATLPAGSTAVLSWGVDSAIQFVSVSPDPGVGMVSTAVIKSGTWNVTPSTTTTYTLTAYLADSTSFTVPPVTITVDASPFSLTSFTTDNAVVPFGGTAHLSWAFTGAPTALTLNGTSVLGSTSTAVVPVRRQVFTLAGSNATASDSKTVTVAAQGLDLLAGAYTGPASKDGNGTAARLVTPFATAMDTAGNLYVADSGANVIRMIDTAKNVNVIAGIVGQAGTTDGALGTSLFNSPRGIVAKADGSVLWVSDYNAHTIRRMDRTAPGVYTVTTISGTPGAYGTTDSAGGTNPTATYDNPWGLLLDDATNPLYLYIADCYKGTIRQLRLSDNQVLTVAGSSYGETDVTNAALSGALLDDPTALAWGTIGTQKVMFVSEYYNGKLRAFTWNAGLPASAAAPLGSSYTLAGSTYGYADGTGASAKFNTPYGLANDGSNNFYVADSSNNNIRKIAVSALTANSGVVTTLAGGTIVPTGGTTPLPGGTDSIYGTVATFNFPTSVLAVGGTLYVTDAGNGAIRTVDLAGDHPTATLYGQSRVPGYANAQGAAARFFNPTSLVTDASGNVYVADTTNHCIRKIDPAGNVTLVAGTPGVSGSTDGAATAASFKGPQGVALDASGNLYVTDTGNKSIRKISAAGTVTTVITALSGPYGITVDPSDTTGNTLWITESSGTSKTAVNAVKKITLSNGTGTAALQVGTTPGAADGAATAALFKFSTYAGIVCDAAGNVYVADVTNSAIRKLTKANSYAVTTAYGKLAGYGYLDSAQLDATNTTPLFNGPEGLAFDAAGNLYVSEYYNHSIRKISTTGTVTTVVGGNSKTYVATGAPTQIGVVPGALPASLFQPKSVGVLPSGDLVVVDLDAVLQVTAPNGQ